MKIRQVEKLFAIVLAVLCCGLGVQLRISLKENDRGTVVYREKVITEEQVPLPGVYDLRQKQKAPEVKNQGSLGTCTGIGTQTTGKTCVLSRSYVTFEFIFQGTE